MANERQDPMAEVKCPDHGSPLPPACPECVAIMERPVSEMTGDERAAELNHWGDTVLTVEFDKLHKRIEELVGRPVWTHELGTDGFTNLLREARTWEHPPDLEAHVIGSLDQLAGDKPVIIAREAVTMASTPADRISDAIDQWYSANYPSGVRLTHDQRAALAHYIAQRLRLTETGRP